MLPVSFGDKGYYVVGVSDFFWWFFDVAGRCPGGGFAGVVFIDVADDDVDRTLRSIEPPSLISSIVL